MTRPRLYLSSPHMSGLKQQYVQDAFATNWIAPLGPHVDAFEAEFAAVVGAPHALALSSGTAALHLALIHLGIEAGNEVLVSTLTFSASANPVVYMGAKPGFVDSDPVSWNLDPALVCETIERKARQGARDAQLAHAASLYTRGEVTLERAAELAETSIYDVMAYLRTHNVAVPANWSDLDLDVVQMLRRVGRMDIAQQFLHETRAPFS